MNLSFHSNARPIPKVSKRRRWSIEEEQLLGTKSDRSLAKKLGRTISAVAARRHQKRISLIKRWRPEDDKLFGTRPDAQVALLLKRPRYQVAYRRRQHGIAFKHPDYHLWKPVEIAMLGKRTDAEVAGLTRRTVKNVRHKRRKLGIPAPELCRWNSEELALLGKRRLTFRSPPDLTAAWNQSGSAACSAAFPLPDIPGGGTNLYEFIPGLYSTRQRLVIPSCRHPAWRVARA